MTKKRESFIKVNHLVYRLCMKPGIQERRLECGERKEQRKCYIPGNITNYFGECPQIFCRISPNIPENVFKHAGNDIRHAEECCLEYRGMSLNILGNVIKHSGESLQLFRRMPSNIYCCLQIIQYGG